MELAFRSPALYSLPFSFTTSAPQPTFSQVRMMQLHRGDMTYTVPHSNCTGIFQPFLLTLLLLFFPILAYYVCIYSAFVPIFSEWTQVPFRMNALFLKSCEIPQTRGAGIQSVPCQGPYYCKEAKIHISKAYTQPSLSKQKEQK